VTTASPTLTSCGEAGVPVTHRHYDGMTHAFFTFVNVFDRGNEAVAQVAADIRADSTPDLRGQPV